MKAEKTSDGKIIITLETNKEKHVMWHLLNKDNHEDLIANSEHFDAGAFEDVSFEMFDEYDDIASDMEELPEEIQVIALRYRKDKNGRPVYECPMCKLYKGKHCDMCSGTGEIFIEVKLAEN